MEPTNIVESFQNPSKDNNLQNICNYLKSPNVNLEEVVNQNSNVFANILIIACERGEREMVNLLLSDKRINRDNQFLNFLNHSLFVACSNNHLSIMKLIIDFAIENSTILLKIDEIFDQAYKKNYTEILTFFIMDYRIEITEKMKATLMNPQSKESVDKLISQRDLYDNLLVSLEINNNVIYNKKKI